MFEKTDTKKWWRSVVYNLENLGYEINILQNSWHPQFGIFWKQETKIQEPEKPSNREAKTLFYFQVTECPASLNIPIPTPAPDHPLGGHEWAHPALSYNRLIMYSMDNSFGKYFWLVFSLRFCWEFQEARALRDIQNRFRANKSAPFENLHGIRNVLQHPQSCLQLPQTCSLIDMAVQTNERL